LDGRLGRGAGRQGRHGVLSFVATQKARLNFRHNATFIVVRNAVRMHRFGARGRYLVESSW
ncbi:MAG TPA: hypothetical protein VF798_01605, partial [Burkholderiaceae bacterium]